MAQDVMTEVQDRVELVEGLEVDRDLTPDYTGIEGLGRAVTRRKLSFKTVAPVAALVLAAAAAGLYYFTSGWESTDDAQIDGYINPISSRVAGYVTHVYVDDNQVVKAGTLLVQIDPKDYQVALESAKAAQANDEATAAASQVNVPVTAINTSSQVMSAQADVNNARAGVSVSEQQLTAAQASLRQAQANLAKAQDDVNRYKQLVDKQEIAEQQYTQAVETADATAAAEEGARASVQAAQGQVTQAQTRLEQAQAELESAQTGPSQVRIQRSRAMASAALVANRARLSTRPSSTWITPASWRL